MGRLFDLVEAHREAQGYEVSYAKIAKKVGVSRQTLLNWRDPKLPPYKEHLEAFARTAGVPYRVVLEAALQDTGLHPELSPRPAPSPGDSEHRAG